MFLTPCLTSVRIEAVPYGWWTSSPEKPHYKGFDESLTGLREVLEKQVHTFIVAHAVWTGMQQPKGGKILTPPLFSFFNQIVHRDHLME